MTDKKKNQRTSPHRVLREVLRHYLEYRDLITHPQPGFQIDSLDGIIEYAGLSISFWDLMDCLKSQKDGGLLSDRKREAIFYNVILDKRQKDVAEIMNITTVSVGQYVEQGVMQLANELFGEKSD